MKNRVTKEFKLFRILLFLLFACAVCNFSTDDSLYASNGEIWDESDPGKFTQANPEINPPDDKNRVKSENPDAEKDSNVHDVKNIKDLTPLKKEKIPLVEAMAVDFIIPGGGALYYRNYYYGIGFAALKLAGAWAIYYFYNDWEYRRSLYYSARRANSSLDPDHELLFKVPGGGYKTVGELKQDYDRSAQRITFSVIGTTVVYLASLLVTYNEVEKINESAVPAFEISLVCDRLIFERGSGIVLYLTYRI